MDSQIITTITESSDGTTSHNSSEKKNSRGKQKTLTEHQILDKLKNSISEGVEVDQTHVNFINLKNISQSYFDLTR